MITRKRFRSASVLPGALLTTPACGAAANDGYDVAIVQTWRPVVGSFDDDRATAIREIVRLGTLAPSSHNTQCWKFAATANGIAISPDWTRRRPAVDPDDRHLFVSLGCVVENLAHAALAPGLWASVRFDAARRNVIDVDLEPTASLRSDLLAAITERQCTCAPFDGDALTVDDLKRLSNAGTSNGIHAPPVDRSAFP